MWSLTQNRIDKVYEFLEGQGIDIMGDIDAEEGRKEHSLSLPEGINMVARVRMYLKEIGKVPLF